MGVTEWDGNEGFRRICSLRSRIVNLEPCEEGVIATLADGGRALVHPEYGLIEYEDDFPGEDAKP